MADALRHRAALGVRLGLIPLAPVLLFVTAILAGSMLSPYADWARMRAWLTGVAVYMMCRLLERRHVVLALRWVGGAVAGLTLLDWALSLGQRPTWENPNLIGSALLLSIPWGGRAGLAVFAALLATYSRGAWLGGGAAWVVHQWEHLRHYRALPILAVAALALLVAQRPGTVALRTLAWNDAAAAWTERPLSGWGLGAWPRISRVEPGKDHPDSLPLTMLAETGLSGFAALGVLGAIITLKARRVGGPAAGALLAWGVHQLVDCTLFYTLTISLVAANVALLEGEAR